VSAAPPTRADLVAHLEASRICGDVATPREGNLRNAASCADRDPHYTFGLDFRGRWSYPDVVAVMAERVGISPDLGHRTGQDRIDPELCVDALERMRERLARAARDRQRVLVATGHPSGILAIHLPVAAELRRAGCELLQPAAGWSYSASGRLLDLRYVADVAMVSNGASLEHTHDPEPMQAMLAALRMAGQPRPDLVLADHGYAGAAGQAGVSTVGFADCNDPALFVGEAEGRVEVAVPLDDNVPPHLYRPVADFLLQGWGRPRGGRATPTDTLEPSDFRM
jgi:hypothetical protein